jgi:cell division protein FtsZ
MEEMGKAMMGTGEAEGETRAIDAAEKAIANPLLDEISLKGARGVLINITGGYDLTLFEMDEAANRIKDEVDPGAMIKFGSAIDPEMEGRMRVSVVATGIDAESYAQRPPLESVPRRRPQTTDPGMMSAVRSTQRRAEPAAEQESVPGAAPEVERNVEVRAATTPTPDDIRARAEEVRQRAMAARAQRDAEHSRPVAVAAGEPELFDDDHGSVDRTPLRADTHSQPGSRPRVEPSLAAERAPERRATAKPVEPESRGQAGRSGLFAINKLIHRVAGGGQQEAPADPAGGADRRAGGGEEDEGEIPAFLRRQAN